MAEGSDAARQVAQVVLLDSDFSVLPDIVGEGRRVVNNITRVAGVFFVKTIYSVLLSLVCLVLNIPFPFMPIQFATCIFGVARLLVQPGPACPWI